MTARNISYSEIQFNELIDRGAHGQVFRGVWQGNDVAVKDFAFGQMSQKEMDAFKREVFVMNCLKHPNTVLLLGACQTPPKLAIVMEFVPGGSLYKVYKHADHRAWPVLVMS